MNLTCNKMMDSPLYRQHAMCCLILASDSLLLLFFSSDRFRCVYAHALFLPLTGKVSTLNIFGEFITLFIAQMATLRLSSNYG